MSPRLEEAMAVVRPVRPDQFGTSTEAVVEGLAMVLAYRFEAERLARSDDRWYESEIMLSDLEDMWKSFSEDFVSIRRRCPPAAWN